ncbi:MAG TPA: hypothetical protein VFO93_06420 [Hymenobacter sp.]|uniref:hypothetical protein n=1 Tax=Hymenobacter sp. TaxID=1898978 RepID=UPI002D81151C|nr:hypothetical protein [Hymenobacter sp.]HET9503155.1 hypothetical protein [Hymenobacter sp.]
MPSAPRLRQLRRDKTLFGLAMNATRLHLEEADRLNQQPELLEAPDDTLQLIQYSIAQWAGLATSYVSRKYRCPTPQAIQLLSELLADIRAGVPVHELRQVPFEVALRLPPELLAQQQQQPEQQQQEQPAAE